MKLTWLLFFSSPLWCANTSVLFQPTFPAVGPFPTDALTAADQTQQTGLRINLPAPSGCSALSTRTDCINTSLENQLDGFNLNPRITVCFSGPVDIGTFQMAAALSPVSTTGPLIKLNQIIFDHEANCAYAKPDQVLNQQTRYLLTITSDLSDASGKRLVADKDFSDCVKHSGSTYCDELSDAIGQFNSKTHGNPLGEVIGASLFTTMSATTWLEKTRAQINSGAIPEAVLPAGPTSIFNLTSIQSMTWMPQSGVVGVNYDRTLPLTLLTGVEKVAFGLFLSPIYLNIAGPQAGTITTTPTKRPNAPPTLVVPVSFHVFLPPASQTPAGGFPVIIYGHGLGDDQFGASTFAANSWAQKGFATLSMEIIGHGYGALGTTKIVTANGTSVVATPGRGIQFSPAAPIGPSDGCILPNAIATRDCSRQTAADLIALIRTIRDTQGLGMNLNPSRIYYVGQSFGSFYGTLLEAVEPNLAAGVLNSGGGSQADAARLSPIARQLGAAYLGSFSPSLLNVPPAPSQDYFHDKFNDEYVYRGQVINDSVPGALPIQAAFESVEWIGMLGDPLGYAGHLSQAPLAGMPAKPMLVQFALGDLEVPNPTESALVRAGGLQNSTWMLRTDIVAAIDPSFLGLIDPTVPYPIYPHRFLSNPTIFSFPLEQTIALAAQNQIADFLASGGATTPNPNQYLPAGLKLFQVPSTLPDGLNFLQIPK